MKVFYKILIVLMGILASFVVAELFLTKFSPQYTLKRLQKDNLHCYKPSDFLPYEYQPHCQGQFTYLGTTTYAKFNNIGLRDPEVGEKTSYRILLVGDSFVFGYSSPDDKKLGSLVKNLLGKGVVSAGFVGDAGPDFEYLYTNRIGLSLKPDLIILSIFPYNDLSDMEETRWKIKDDTLVSISSSKYVDNNGFLKKDKLSRIYQIPYLRESNLAIFLNNFLNRVLQEYFRSQNSVSTVENTLYANCLYKEQCNDYSRDIIAKVDETFRLWGKLNEDTGIPVVAMVIPYYKQIDGSEPATTIFHKYLEKHHILYLDLYTSFANSGEKRGELFLKDGHWTMLGTQIAAEGLAKFLNESIFK